MTYRNSNDIAERSSVSDEVFALTDEQILGMEPEEGGAQDAEITPGSLRSEPQKARLSGRDDGAGLANEKHAGKQDGREERSSRVDEDRSTEQARVPVPLEAPGWLLERMKDPWSGQEAREFWEGAQKAERDVAAYREVFATPEDAKALREIYPGGAAEAKGAVERVRQLEEIDAAYFGATGKAPEELSSARVALAERLFAQDPAAFREMVAVGMRLVGGAGNATSHTGSGQDAASKPVSLRSVASAPNYGAEEKTGHSGRDDNSHLAAAGYVEFERAANAELEKSVGRTIARMMDEALPNLRHASRSWREGQAAPIQVRLADAVREEVETGLKSDGQLGEQVAKILSGRRFDEAARRQVVRLIDARAQQLVPGAVRRVVGTWTQGTLGGGRKREADGVPPGTEREKQIPHPPRVRDDKRDSSGKTNEGGTRGMAAGRGVDYRRLSDEQILEL
jgi:hypothetical protein